MKPKLVFLNCFTVIALGAGPVFADVISDKPGTIDAKPVDAGESEEKADSNAPAGKAPFTTPSAVDEELLKEGVQITELGTSRLLLVLSPSAGDVDKLIKQRLSDVHFRVFPSSVQLTEEEIEPRALHKMGNERYCDFVAHVQTSSRLRNKLGNFELHEGETTVTIYDPMSGEIKVIHTARNDGERKPDSFEAERSAREASADAAVVEAATKLLEKAHKAVLYEAEFRGVKDNRHLLKIIKYAGELADVYHVRQMTFDKESGVAVIEMIAAPATENFWRAHLETWPEAEEEKAKKKPFRFRSNKELREGFKDWFAE